MSQRNVAFQVIENSGPNNLRDALRTKCANAAEVCIAVAFVSESGLDEIIESLRQVAIQGKVRLLTGLYQSFTEPKALETLLIIQKQTRGTFSVHISREPQFHRKVFLFEESSRATAIIGSSNLTKDGLRSGGELCLMFSISKEAASYKGLKSAFEKDWGRARSVPLTRELLDKYRAARPAKVKPTNISKAQFKKVVNPPKAPPPPPPDGKSHFWRDCITGFVKPKTEKIVSETTNWDEKNYWWYSPGSRPPFEIGDQIFLFDFAVKRFALVEVKDITHMVLSTPDGRDFVAYKNVRNYSRRYSKKLWAQLKNEGIKTQQNARERRNLKTGTVERLKSILRRSKPK